MKTILITGASGGIGFAILKLLSQNEDYKIIAHHNQNSKGLENLKQTSTANIELVQADLSNLSEVNNLFMNVKSVDVLINALGIEDSGKDPLDTKSWEKMWNVNFYSIVEICRKAISLMNNSSTIINISSIMGKHDVAVPIELTGYATAKAALNKFTLNLAYNLAPKIRAVTISPGYTKTKMWDGFPEEDKKECIQATPIKRFVTPEEIAKAVLSVMENEAITAQDIIVDGGLGIKQIV